MTHPNENQSPIEAAKKAATAARTAVHASRVEHATATAQLEAARTKYLADSSAPNQKAVISAEDAVRFCEMRMTDLGKKLEAASATLAQLERDSRLAQHAARAREISFESFASATSKVASKLASARAALVDAEAEAASKVRGFAHEAELVRAEAAELGAPRVAVLDYSKVLTSLVAKVEGKPAAAILETVFATRAPAGVSPDEALALLNAGIDARAVASLVATLKDATARAATSAKLVVLGNLEATRGADKTLTACGRFSSALAEARSARAALAELGLKAAADAVKPDALSEKLSAVGAEKVHALLLKLRMVEGLNAPGYPTPQDNEKHRNEAAKPIVAQIESLGFGAEYIEAVRPSSRAQGVTHTSAPQGPVGFVNVGAQGL